jgi:hypothetical protein
MDEETEFLDSNPSLFTPKLLIQDRIQTKPIGYVTQDHTHILFMLNITLRSNQPVLSAGRKVLR